MENKSDIIPILCALWIIVSAESYNTSTFLSEDIPQDTRYMTSLIHLLSNLTDNESQLLIEYVQQRAYANLKEMIDEMRNNVRLFSTFFSFIY
ncbi:unnamed protein product [Toxocara canis]|uniref:Secreted protein n=1 Tax=Toxocara canis TaxID=6265 RepID=A0A183V9J7_TOXCA|nr:unnamed protein product [Toxocara canis]